jgi:hypothetical protein
MVKFKLWLEDYEKIRPYETEINRSIGGVAANAIDDFVGHKLNPEEGAIGLMDPTKLEDAYSPNPSAEGVIIKNKIEKIMIPFRSKLHEIYGRYIPLYRNEYIDTPKVRYTLSYTMDKKFAEFLHYQHEKPMVYYTIEEFIEIPGISGGYWTNMQKQDMKNIMGTYQTYFEDKKEAQKIAKQLTLKTGNKYRAVRDEDSVNEFKDVYGKLKFNLIPPEDVIWVTDRANQQEFIVKNKNYIKLPFDKVIGNFI